MKWGIGKKDFCCVFSFLSSFRFLHTLQETGGLGLLKREDLPLSLSVYEHSDNNGVVFFLLLLLFDTLELRAFSCVF